MYEYDEPSLGQAFANILRGVKDPQQWQQAGQGIVNTAQIIPNVAESLVRGGVAQAVGTMGDLRDLRNTVQSYLPQSVQNWSNAAEFMTNPYAKALIQTAPTTEQTLEAVPRMTSTYEGAGQHEVLGEFIAPSLGYFGGKALKVGKNLPVGLSIEDVTPPPAKVAEALRQPEKNALGFYSPLEEAVLNLKNEKGTGQQYLAQLLKTQGVKQEEVATRGLDTFLNENPKVSKEQLINYLRENPVQLKETVLGVREPYDANRLNELETQWSKLKEHPIDDPSFGEEKYNEMIKLMNLRDNSTTDSLYRLYDEAISDGQLAQRMGKKDLANKFFKEAELYNTRAEKLDLEGLGSASPTRFGKPDFNLPNGENYREVLIQYDRKKEPPKPVFSVQADTMSQSFGTKAEAEAYKAQLLKDYPNADIPIVEKNITANPKFEATPDFVNRNHFEQPNILAHMRVDDRVIDGKKTLFIQEIQSDWHQKGRKEGYQTKVDTTDLIRELTPEDKQRLGVDKGVLAKVKDTWGYYPSKKEAEQYLQFTLGTGAVPDAPFKKNWQELAMKRAMQMAAEGGYDRVAFTTGKQQADRYSLQKQVKLISAMPTKEGKYNVYLEGLDGDPLFRNRDGFSEYGQKTMTPEEMEATVGKEVTKKLIEGKPNKEGWVDVRDKDLTVGGEGMQGFYDKILPDFINKYGKKHGLKVGQTSIKAGRDTGNFNEFVDWAATQDTGIPMNRGELMTLWERYKEGQNVVLVDRYMKSGADQSQNVHYFDLTPEAKESFLKKGQPMFAVAPALAITDEDSRREVLEKLFNSKK